MPDLSLDRQTDERHGAGPAGTPHGEAVRRAAAQLAAARVTKDRGRAVDAQSTDCGALFWSWAAPERHADR